MKIFIFFVLGLQRHFSATDDRRAQDPENQAASNDVPANFDQSQLSSQECSCFLVPYDRNPHFSGREQLLEELKLRLSEAQPKQYSHRLALYGLGGIGKTQLALEYAYRYRTNYSSVFWISAVTRAKLLSGFIEIADASQCFRYAKDEQPEKIANATIQWLSTTNHRWLLIIDNLDDITIADGLIPRIESKGHVLITTRNQNSAGIPAEGFEVLSMSADEALNFFLLRAQLTNSVITEDHNEASEIVERLGYLPLAIEQAAAYVRMSRNTREYLLAYEQDRKRLLSWMPEGNRIYHSTVATTWRLSFANLASTCPDSINLIRLLVFLNPDEVLIAFLKSGCSGLGPKLRSIIQDPFQLRVCLFALQNFSLIRVWDDGRKITIHRLVQDVIKAELDERTREATVRDVINLGLVAFPEPATHMASAADPGHQSLSPLTVNIQLCQHYSSQVISCFEQTQNTAFVQERHVLGGRLALYFRMSAFYMDSLRMWTLTSEIRERLLGPQHPDTLRSKKYEAEVLCSVGQPQKAVELLQRSIEISKSHYRPEDNNIRKLMEDLAKCHVYCGEDKISLRLHIEIVDTCIRAFGADDNNTLDSMCNLAEEYARLDHCSSAVDLYQKTLDIQSRRGKPGFKGVLNSIAGLAKAYCMMGLDDNNISLYERLQNLRLEMETRWNRRRCESK